MTLARAASGLVFALVLFFTLAVARAAEVPRLRGHVNDYADVIAPEVEARLEKELIDYESATGRQYAVLTLPTLGGEDIEGFSIRTVEAWKLGQKKQDNGLLLLVVPGDRKTRIEVGYGLEGEITDARSSRIIREILSPAFRAGDFSGGISAAVDDIVMVLEGNAAELEARARRNPSQGADDFDWIVALFIILWFTIFIGGFAMAILPPIFGRKIGPNKYRWLGMDFTVGGGRRRSSGWTTGTSSGGWSGGGWSSGRGGGGFSGGGGSSGGGGASGSW